MGARTTLAGSCALAAVVAACGPRAPTPRAGVAAEQAGAALELALYPSTAMVVERRTVQLERGRNEVAFAELPRGLDAGSVRFVSLSDPGGTRAVEQQVGAATAGGGALPAWAELTDDPQRPLRVRSQRGVERHAARPGGARWIVESAAGGSQRMELRYQTGGVQWRADYAIVLVEGGGATADLNAWITVDNRSGRTFRDARVTLMTRAPDAAAPPGGASASNLADGRGASTTYPAQPQYAPPAPASPRYRAYAYPRPVTLRDRVQRQLEWFAAPLRGLASRKLMVFDPVGDTLDRDERTPVKARDFGLGGAASVTVGVELPAVDRALPPGRARVFERAGSGALSLLGETAFAGAAAGEPLRLQLGAVPGLAGRRRQTDFGVSAATRRLVEELEIELTNAGSEPREVVVREHLYRGARFAVTAASAPYASDGPRAVRFALSVPAAGSATLRYRVVYSWDADDERSEAGAPDAPAASAQP